MTKKAKIIYKARLNLIEWELIGGRFGVSRQAITKYAKKHGVIDKLEKHRKDGLKQLDKEVRELST